MSTDSQLEFQAPSSSESEQSDARVHISIGAVCNNNCIFCMEEDRETRYTVNSRTTDEVIRWILEENAGCEEICFTSGEPTLNKRLPLWVSWAKAAGVPRISVMTNGRSLGYETYSRMLVKAGMNRFYVSIHGHEKRLHEGLTRTPDSFEQTVAGGELEEVDDDLASLTAPPGCRGGAWQVAFESNEFLQIVVQHAGRVDEEGPFCGVTWRRHGGVSSAVDGEAVASE